MVGDDDGGGEVAMLVIVSTWSLAMMVSMFNDGWSDFEGGFIENGFQWRALQLLSRKLHVVDICRIQGRHRHRKYKDQKTNAMYLPCIWRWCWVIGRMCAFTWLCDLWMANELCGYMIGAIN